jgi:hypothetical protein
MTDGNIRFRIDFDSYIVIDIAFAISFPLLFSFLLLLFPSSSFHFARRGQTSDASH